MSSLFRAGLATALISAAPAPSLAAAQDFQSVACQALTVVNRPHPTRNEEGRR